mgnify:CR=1 FL=1
MAIILVLDDVFDAGAMVKKILEKKGYQVVHFTEEEDAIKHVRKNKIDLAILDIKLKKMCGIEVLEEMKKIVPDIQAIMLTGYPEMGTASRAAQLGANDYCIKPIDKDELEEKVKDVLSS